MVIVAVHRRERSKGVAMSGQRSRKIHQRSSSTGSGLLFGIGAAAGPHHVIHPQHHLLASQQLSSPSPDPLTSDDEESEDLDIKGTYSKNWTVLPLCLNAN